MFTEQEEKEIREVLLFGKRKQAAGALEKQKSVIKEQYDLNINAKQAEADAIRIERNAEIAKIDDQIKELS